MADLNLFKQDSRIQMPDNTYFPFTHTISDLETVNIIGVPSSKTISIPRSQQNDELFGYLCDITRDNFGYEDGKVGVSFNQIKKCEYRLQNESEVVSEGLLSVDDITDKEYKITLYDKLIQKLEELEGDEDTGEYFLNDIDILSGGNPLSFDSNSATIKTMITGLTSSIVPVACIRNNNNNDIADDKIRCMTSSGVTETIDLPTDCTSLQLRTLKSYEFNYATPITTIIEGINYKYGDIITIDESITGLTNETYMLLNNPVNEENLVTITNDLEPGTSATTGATYNYTIKNTSDYYLCTENGHKYMYLNIGVEWKTNVPGWIIGGVKEGPFWTETYYVQTTGENSTPNGTLFSRQWAKVEMVNGNSSTTPIYLEMDLYKNTNTTFNDTGEMDFTDTLKVITQVQLDLDFYPQFAAVVDPSSELRITIQNYNPSTPNITYQIFGAGAYVNQIEVRGGSTCTESKLPFRSNDTVTTNKILPKISIKEFVIQLAKFFNLDVVVEDDKLKLQHKKYYLTDEVLEIKSIEGMATNNISFNKLKLIPSLPQSDILDNYETKYKSIYGSQLVTTGYSIKNNTKEINLDTAIPVLLRDFNSFAYQSFAGYLNGGYAKNPHGLVNGLEDKITFCYVQRVNEKLYVTDDTPFEGGMNNGTITGVTEVGFVHYNPMLYCNTALAENDNNKFYFSGTTDLAYGASILDYYYTASPYYWSGTTITKSLDMGKPNINYAGIPDSWYPSGSTLYYKYHRNMLIDMYNSNTHILNAKIFIDGSLDIYKIYNYRGSFYIVSQATEYDPTKPDFYSVKLMRVNNPNNYINNIQ